MPKSGRRRGKSEKDALEQRAEQEVARLERLLKETKAEVARSKNLVNRLAERKRSGD